MTSATMHLEPVFFWLLRATAQVSLLVGVILLLQWALGRRLGIHGRCFLWLILLGLLSLPWTPSRFAGVDRLLPWSTMKGYASSLLHRANRTDGASMAADDVRASEELQAQRVDETMVSKRLPWPVARRLNTPTVRLLALVWVIGIGAFAGTIGLAHVRLRRILASASPVTDRDVLALLDECKRLMGVRKDVGVLSTEAIGSPALFGYRRPRLLLSGQLLAGPEPGELRHIILHELAHLRRHDILVGHIIGLLHVLQWFNPLVALAFRRMRADRELACDALALSVMEQDETWAYGRTVVRQLERLQASRRPPILAALTGDRSRIKQRIALIAGFDKTRYRRSPLTSAFVLCLTCIGLVVPFAASRALGGAVESAVVTWDIRARRSLPTTHQDRHANIQRVCIRNMLTGKFLAVEGERVTCDADEPGEMGLWEYRFDEVSNTAESDVYVYSVAARKYLTSDDRGNLAVDADEPTEAAAWGTAARPQGVWLISHCCKEGYLRPNEAGPVRAEFWGRDAASYWDVHAVWRVKTSDDPAANPEWQREKIPGPD